MRISRLLFFCLCCSFSLHAQLKVMTYNIRLDYTAKNSNTWDERKEKVFGQIKSNQIDVFGIQEGMPNQIVHFKEAFPKYTMVGVGRDDGANQGEYSSVFFKSDRFELLEGNTFWLSLTPEIPSKGWDAALNRVCSYVHLKDKKTAKTFWVFNTHFDHMGEEARQQSVLLILEKIKTLTNPDEVCILMGDFNLNEDHPSIHLLQEKLQDARLRARKIIGKTQFTFNNFDTLQPATQRIDYIFVQPSIRIKSFETLVEKFGKSYPSDHFPIIATLKF